MPGTGFGRNTWRRFRELAATRLRVIAYDRRGFTQAAPDPAPSMRVNADDAAALLEHLDAVPAHVLGWSAGGLVATCLAIEHRLAGRSPYGPVKPCDSSPANGPDLLAST